MGVLLAKALSINCSQTDHIDDIIDCTTHLEDMNGFFEAKKDWSDSILVSKLLDEFIGSISGGKIGEYKDIGRGVG